MPSRTFTGLICLHYDPFTAIEVDRGPTKAASASGTFTFNSKVTTDGGYQYSVPTKG